MMYCAEPDCGAKVPLGEWCCARCQYERDRQRDEYLAGDSVSNTRDANSGIRVGTAQCPRLSPTIDEVSVVGPTAGRACYRPPSQSLLCASQFLFGEHEDSEAAATRGLDYFSRARNRRRIMKLNHKMNL
jgi:hypothetical protein